MMHPMKVILAVTLAVCLQLQQAQATPLQTISLPTANATSIRVSSISSINDGLLIGQRLGNQNATSGVFYYSPGLGKLEKLLGSGYGCSDQGGPDMFLQPVSITALSDRQFLVTESMWSSRVWLASGTLGHTVANSNLTIQKVVGSLCNFTETMVMVNNSNVSFGDVAIAPPDYTAYRAATQQLFFTQRASIVAITDRIASVYFGTNEKRTRTSADVTGFRTDISTAFPTQMAIAESMGCMFFPEETIGYIRKIDFDTGLTSIVAGSALLPSWPPPDCNSSVPCRALESDPSTLPALYLIYVKALVFHRLGSVPNLYFADITLSLLFKLDLSTTTVQSIAGQLLTPGNKDGEVGTSQFVSAYELAIWGDLLVMASGTIRSMYVGTATPPAPPKLCDVVDDCSGKAWEVYGLPAIGCDCVCRNGTSGPRCEVRAPWNKKTRTRTASHQATKTKTQRVTKSFTEQVVPPQGQIIPVPVIRTVKATVAVTSVVVGVISTPTGAVQASRATILLDMAQCDSNIGDPVDWPDSPLQLQIGSDAFRYVRGAVSGNFLIWLVVFTLHAAAAIVYGSVRKITTLMAFAFLRFPSLGAFFLMFLLQGTSQAAVVMLIHSPVAFDRVLGAAGLLFGLGFVAFIVRYMILRFQCPFTPAVHEVNRPGKKCEEKAMFVIKWILVESGKWEHNPEGFRKRFGGYFRDYRPTRQAFLLAEIVMCLAVGIVAGVQPEEGTPCVIVTVIMALLFIGFFLVVVVMRPYLARINTAFSLVVNGLQAAGAFCIGIYVLTHDRDWQAASNSFAIASVYVTLIEAILSLLGLIRKVGYFCWKKSRGEASSSDSDSLLDVPMLQSGPGNNLAFNPADELSSLGSSNPNSFAFPSRAQDLEAPIGQGPLLPPQQGFNISISSSSSEHTPVPRVQLEHERRRQELQSLLDAGAPTSGTVNSRTGGYEGIPSLIIAASMPATRSPGAPPPHSSSSDSNQSRSREPSNLSFTSLLAELRQEPEHASPAVVNLSFGRRRPVTYALPGTHSSSSESRQMAGGSSGSGGSGEGFNAPRTSSSSTSSLGEPPNARRPTVEGKKES